MTQDEYEAVQRGNFVILKYCALGITPTAIPDQRVCYVVEKDHDSITLMQLGGHSIENIQPISNDVLSCIAGIPLSVQNLTANGFVEIASYGNNHSFSYQNIIVVERQGEWLWQKTEQGQTELIPVRYFHDLQNRAGLVVDFDRTVFPTIRITEELVPVDLQSTGKQ